MKFSVQSKNQQPLEGNWIGTTSPLGLGIAHPTGGEIKMPIGTTAKRESGKRINLEHENMTFTLVVEGNFFYNEARYAKDLTAFLSGSRTNLNEADYKIERELIVLALLPLAIPLLTLSGLQALGVPNLIFGAIIPGIVALILCVLCIAVISAESLGRTGKIAICICITLAGFLPAIGFLQLLKAALG